MFVFVRVRFVRLIFQSIIIIIVDICTAFSIYACNCYCYSQWFCSYLLKLWSLFHQCRWLTFHVYRFECDMQSSETQTHAHGNMRTIDTRFIIILVSDGRVYLSHFSTDEDFLNRAYHAHTFMFVAHLLFLYIFFFFIPFIVDRSFSKCF